MNNNTISTDHETLLACPSKPLTMFKYQAVFNYEYGKRYLKSINLIRGENILKKFYLPKQILISDDIDPDKLIVENLTSILSGTLKPGMKIGTVRSQKNKERKKARAKAATDLFENLGI